MCGFFISNFTGRRRPRADRRREPASIHGAPEETLSVVAGLEKKISPYTKKER